MVKGQSGGKSKKKAISPKSPKTVPEKKTLKITAKPPKAKSAGQPKIDKNKVAAKTKVPVAVKSKSKKATAKK